MARPTKLNKETHDAIVNALKIGATRKDAAGAAGVNYVTFLDWLEKGDKAKKGSALSEFSYSVKQAEHHARLVYTQVIAKAASAGDWRAAMEYLKRRDPEHWSDNTQVAGGDNKIEIVVKYADADDKPTPSA